MSTPSFSSFPPSFASFSDLDPGPSRCSPEHSNSAKDRKAGVKDKRTKHKRKRSDSDGYGEAKTKKDHVEIADLPPSAFSDRKGDPLNIRYGGLHTRDIPKYHIVGRMSFSKFLGDLL
jgi:hypothetical protein